MDELRRCDDCGKTKPVTEEHWRMRMTKTKGMRPYERVCAPCSNERSNARRQRQMDADPEGYRARHNEAQRERQRAEREADPEGYRAEQAAKQRELRARGGDAQRAKQAEYARRSRARKKANSQGN